jgi:hypothetical protein
VLREVVNRCEMLLADVMPWLDLLIAEAGGGATTRR